MIPLGVGAFDSKPDVKFDFVTLLPENAGGLSIPKVMFSHDGRQSAPAVSLDGF